MEQKGIALGTSDFKKIRLKDNYYIDKTKFIKDIIDNQSEVLLINRPRRFGKTLNMSMLRYYFDCTIKDGKELFKRPRNNESRRKIHIKTRILSMYIHDTKRCKRKKL